MYTKLFKKIGIIICKNNKNNLELNNIFFENSYSSFHKKFLKLGLRIGVNISNLVFKFLLFGVYEVISH